MKTEPTIVRGKIYQDVYDKRTASTAQSGLVADLVTARMDGSSLVFLTDNERDTAMRAGVFLLRIPDDLELSEADDLAASFYERTTISSNSRPYRDLDGDLFADGLLGFQQRTDQIEQFLLEARFWPEIYPEPVLRVAERLTEMSQQIVCAALGYAGIPEPWWPVASGGCTERSGSYHLTLNHYRPNERRTGLSAHKDDGFVTILRAVDPGLEVNVDRHWEIVPTAPDVFVINFGLATEILTRGATRPIAAILHRVFEQTTDRSSYALFSSSRCEPGRDAGIYGYSPIDGLQQVCGSRELIYENDHEIYEGTDAPR